MYMQVKIVLMHILQKRAVRMRTFGKNKLIKMSGLDLGRKTMCLLLRTKEK